MCCRVVVYIWPLRGSRSNKKNETLTHGSDRRGLCAGAKTGRSPKDKRIVKDETFADVWWGAGSPNVAIEEADFIRNRERALDYLHMLDEVRRAGIAI